MKQLLISFLIICPFFTMNGFEVCDDDDYDRQFLFTHVNDNSKVNFRHMSHVTLRSTCEIVPDRDLLSDILAAQEAPESHKEPLDDLFKSAYGDNTDLDNCRFLSPLFTPHDFSIAHAAKIDDSKTENEETDNEWLLSKSRGGRKWTSYQQHERGQHEKEKQNISRKSKWHAIKRKINTAAYATLKADELLDLKKHVLNTRNYANFKAEDLEFQSDSESKDDSVSITSSESEDNLVSTTPFDSENSSVSEPNQEPVYSDGNFNPSARRVSNEPIVLCLTPQQFSEQFKQRIPLRDKRFTLEKLRKGFDDSLTRINVIPDNTPHKHVPLGQSTIDTLNKMRSNLPQVTMGTIDEAMGRTIEDLFISLYDDKGRPYLDPRPVFADFLIDFARELNTSIANEQTWLKEEQNQTAALDARYSNIPAQTDEDFDAACDLAKSRGTRKRNGYQQHERDRYRQKKQNSVALERAQKSRKDKRQYARLKAAQLVDTREHLLKPHEYDSFKKETTPSKDEVTELTQSFDSLSLRSESDSTSSDTSGNESDEDCSVCSDYKECDNPECTYHMTKIFCKCPVGKALRETKVSSAYMRCFSCGSHLPNIYCNCPYGKEFRKKFREEHIELFRELVRTDKQEEQDQAAAHDACHSNIPTQTDEDDEDFDAACDLSKSRSTRKRNGYQQHERDRYRQKKQNSVALERAQKSRKDKKQYALLKAAQLVDTQEHLLKPHEYDSLKEEAMPSEDGVTELIQSLDSLSLHSESDSSSSTSSDEYEREKCTAHEKRCFFCGSDLPNIDCNCPYGKEFRKKLRAEYRDARRRAGFDSLSPSDSDSSGNEPDEDYYIMCDCSDYKECDNPECTYHLTKIFCKCSAGKALREKYEMSQGVCFFEGDTDDKSEWSNYSSSSLRSSTPLVRGIITLEDEDFELCDNPECNYHMARICCKCPEGNALRARRNGCDISSPSDDMSYRDIVLTDDQFDKGLTDLQWYRNFFPELNLIILDNHTFNRMSLEDYSDAQKEETTRWVFSPHSLVGFYFALANAEEDERKGTNPVQEVPEKTTTSHDDSFAPQITVEQFLTSFEKGITDYGLTLEKLRDRFNAVLDTKDVCSGEEPATIQLDFDTREYLNNLYFNISQATDDDINSALVDAGMKLWSNKSPLFSTYLIEFARELGRADKQAYTQDKLIRRQEEQDRAASHDARHSNIPPQTDEDFDAAWHLSKSRGTDKRK